MKKIILILVGFLSIQSCMKDTFDNPAQIKDPNLTATTDIRSIKNNYTSSGLAVMPITDDAIISGVVIADDKSNNFYKEIVIQDNSGAIGIKIDRSNLYNDYPIGRRVFIKLKGMAMGNYNNLIQLGGYVDTVSAAGVRALGSVTSTSLPNHIIKGSLGNEVKFEEKTISALTNDDQYKLIKLVGVEFDCADIALTYADAANQADASRNLTDGGTTNKAVVRTSGYSSFAGIKLAQGNGEFKGIYTVYRTTKQFIIRDTADMKMTGTRVKSCSGSGGGGGGGSTTFTPKTIKEIRDMFSGTSKAITGYSIEGIVISDKSNNNVNSRTVIIQEQGGAGIAVYLNSTNGFSLGDKIKIDINSDSLTLFKGLLQLSSVNNSDVSVTGTGTITPAVKTISEVISQYATLESTLVKINSVNITSTTGATYSGTKKLGDGSTSTLDLYTATGASFASTNFPTTTVSITGIIGIFVSTKQMTIRNTSDVQ